MSALWRMIVQPHAQRRNRGATWPVWAVVGLAAVAAGWAVAGRTTGRAAHLTAFFAGLGAALLVTLLWIAEALPGLMRQASPLSLRLVPGARRRLALALTLEWLAAVALDALALGPIIGHPVQVALGGALFLLFACWQARWPWGGFVAPPLIVLLLGPPTARVFLAKAGFFEGNPVVLGVGAAVVVAGGALTLRMLLPPGGEAQHAVWARFRRFGSLGSTARATIPARAGERVLYAGYFGTLRRALVATPGSGARLVPLCLGPDAHWTVTLLVFPVGASLGAVPFLAASALAGGDPRVQLGIAVVLAAVSLVLFPVGQLGLMRLALWRRRREQALVRLAPGVPAGVALNRALARHLLVPFMAAWSVGLAGALLLGAVGPVLPAPFAGAVLAGSFITLPLAGLVLDDYARLRSPSVARGLVLLGAVVTLSVVVAWLYRAPVAAVAVASVLAAAAFVAARWRRMLAAPPAFPAGRLAD